MDTSDSEYFESADEDFKSDSEEETEKSLHTVEQILFSDNMEAELCKLQITEQKKDDTIKALNSIETEARTDVYEENKNIDEFENREKSYDSVVKDECDNFLNTNISSDLSRNLNCVLEITNKNPYIAKPQNRDKYLLDTSNSNFKIEENSKSLKTDNETPTLGVKEENNEAPKADEKQSTLGVQKEKSEALKADDEKSTLDVKEDNLWEDDEIDWGSETTKEESSNMSRDMHKRPITFKEDNDGWEDFDAEWETTKPDFPPQPQKNNEGVTGIRNPIQTRDIEKSELPSKEKNLWNDDDDWEPIEKPEEKQNQPEVESSGWGGWGNWGVSSILTTATQSVSTLTNHVSQGISTVLESGMGVPDPEELARINKLDKETTLLNEKSQISGETLEDLSSIPVSFNLGHLVSGVSQLTKFVETTGSKVISGGLDTLEAIGKKTAEVLQEGDPGLKKKRALLKLDSGKPNLSQILREAKERAEQENDVRDQKHLQVKKFKNYETLFDDHQGLVHLEALEMISKLCTIKLGNLKNALDPDALQELEETLEQIKELCELPEDDEEEKISLENAKETIETAVKEINVPIMYHRLFSICEETETWLQNVNINLLDVTDLHRQGIEFLAHVTALAVEQFHKCGELLLVKDHRSTADEADSLAQITTTIKLIVVTEASKFTEKMGLLKLTDNISEYITNIFYEAANSGRYIQDAFQLLIPVLQVGAV